MESGERSGSSIRLTQGIIAIVSFGLEGKPALVNANVKDEIRRVETFYLEKSSGLQFGDVVSLTDLPFKRF